MSSKEQIEAIKLARSLEAIIESDFSKNPMPEGSVHLLAAANELRARAALSPRNADTRSQGDGA